MNEREFRYGMGPNLRQPETASISLADCTGAGSEKEYEMMKRQKMQAMEREAKMQAMEREARMQAMEREAQGTPYTASAKSGGASPQPAYIVETIGRICKHNMMLDAIVSEISRINASARGDTGKPVGGPEQNLPSLENDGWITLMEYHLERQAYIIQIIGDLLTANRDIIPR